MNGGHGRNAEAGAGLQAHFIRQLDRLRGGQCYKFGSGAEGALPLPIPDPDPLAQARFGDAVADLVDLACAVAVRDQARPGDLAGRTLARFDIGRVDAGVAEFDPHLAGAGLRRLFLSHAQYLARGTVLLVIGGSHALSPRLTCLLYTSDAADDLTRVDLGGR